MQQVFSLIEQPYATTNERDIHAAFLRIRDEISWSRASQDAQVVGKDEVRASWMRQWQQVDPHI